MYNEDQQILQEIQVTKNLRDTTIATYRQAIKTYTQYNGQSMASLIMEAEAEEEKGVRWKHRTIRRRLISYRAHLLQEYEYTGTTRTYLTKILAIYRYYEIELQPLPAISTRNKKNETIKYEDLPDKTVIRRSLNAADTQLRAIILFMVASGTARTETTNLTIQDFITATSEYHKQTDIYEVLNELDPTSAIVPTWKIHRQKTNKEYYTFSTPESTRAIIDYLTTTERRLSPEARLFNIGPKYLTTKFSILNDRLGLGKVGHDRRLRPHMLRKYHATQLTQGVDCLSVDEVDSLQGRSKSSVHRAYFLDNPEDLKRKYARNMGALYILEEEKDNGELAELQRRYDELQANVKEAAREEVRRILLDLGYEL